MSHHLTSYVDGPTHAAQYLRMSTDYQRYSIENQRSAIAEYAREHGYTIVASYIDAGKSGLSLHGRDALKRLLSDVLATHRSFDAVLVLDVSRWGRFQNPDQAAHYEFLCREAGVRVIYCGEPFGDDLTPMTTIVKHLKRVMAGEYSRELSTKMSRAHRQQAQLGFRQGAKLIYGFRRLLVDSSRNPKQLLGLGERKAIGSDRVVVVPGPPDELAVIRRIFRLYVTHHLPFTAIAERLAKDGVRSDGGRPLEPSGIRRILSNELCIGQMTYNRTTKGLQDRASKNPKQLWIRSPAFSPIVPIRQFERAQERLAQWVRQRWDKESIIKFLQNQIAEKGCLTQQSIRETEGAPSKATIVRRFGSLTAAYAAVGYKPPPRISAMSKYWTKRRILAGLRRLHDAKGHISNRLIDSFPGLPSQDYIRNHLGSIPEALKQGRVACLVP
jgi:DNA invertase Pin-like site-specific DNA recombinase